MDESGDELSDLMSIVSAFSYGDGCSEIDDFIDWLDEDFHKFQNTTSAMTSSVTMSPEEEEEEEQKPTVRKPRRPRTKRPRAAKEDSRKIYQHEYNQLPPPQRHRKTNTIPKISRDFNRKCLAKLEFLHSCIAEHQLLFEYMDVRTPHPIRTFFILTDKALRSRENRKATDKYNEEMSIWNAAQVRLIETVFLLRGHPLSSLYEHFNE